MSENLSVYDATKKYKEEILPLVNQIKKVCAINSIPFFFTCAVKNDEKETQYENEGVLTGSYGINLKTDYFAPILGVLNGGRVIFTTDEDEALPGELSAFLADTEDAPGSEAADDDITIIDV